MPVQRWGLFHPESGLWLVGESTDGWRRGSAEHALASMKRDDLEILKNRVQNRYPDLHVEVREIP